LNGGNSWSRAGKTALGPAQAAARAVLFRALEAGADKACKRICCAYGGSMLRVAGEGRD
jgi:hypothetical protein